jgi:transglutaminase-like putative cysteine protease
MRIRIHHAIAYAYDTPPTGVTQMLRLTPRNHDGQYVLAWRIDLSRDCQLHQHEDAFGNITHSFTAEGPFNELVINVEGEVDTQDSNGVVSGTLERFPPSLFLRETALTQVDGGIADFAETIRAEAAGEPLALLHTLLREINNEMDFDPTHAAAGAAEAFPARRGGDWDIAHVFIAGTRRLGIPARFVSGHCRRGDGAAAPEACHAWAEAHVDRLGWIGFDPTHGICVTDAYVRVAVGLDYLGAAPVRGQRFGGSGETAKTVVQIAQAGQQSQS